MENVIPIWGQESQNILIALKENKKLTCIIVSDCTIHLLHSDFFIKPVSICLLWPLFTISTTDSCTTGCPLHYRVNMTLLSTSLNLVLYTYPLDGLATLVQDYLTTSYCFVFMINKGNSSR